MNNFFQFFNKKRTEVSFDEILVDASNLPSFNVGRMEGRMELPLSKVGIVAVGCIFVLVVSIFLFQLYTLQILHGIEYAEKSVENSIETEVIIAERGVVTDRFGELIAWNERDQTGVYDFPVRAYIDRRGFGQLIGYVSYPKRDRSGNYFRTEYIGRGGIEESFDETLRGKNGEQRIEEDVYGSRVKENEIVPATPGLPLQLSIDTHLSEVMYDLIATTTIKNGFRSGAAAMMDVHTGEIVALASYPSYDPEVLADGDNTELIEAYNKDSRFPFLNKVVGGVYTPGSIVKPFVAYGALAEDLIDPGKIIVSNGSLVVPNPYDPEKPTVFNDWRAHGPMTIRDAIAYSSNVFFFALGGGIDGQRGLGITRLASYMHLFGLGSKTGVDLYGEAEGVVPTPAWKEKTFDDEWRLGDTYLTSIGQYGFQSTPLQMLRAYAAIANNGDLVTPVLIASTTGARTPLSLDQSALTIVKEGMRRTVIQDGGTARALERKDVEIAAKSGTAELGASKAQVNSWIAGYFPYKEPRYAFILFMENGPRSNTVGAGSVMGQVFDWIAFNRPEYFE